MKERLLFEVLLTAEPMVFAECNRSVRDSGRVVMPTVKQVDKLANKQTHKKTLGNKS